MHMFIHHLIIYSSLAGNGCITQWSLYGHLDTRVQLRLHYSALHKENRYGEFDFNLKPIFSLNFKTDDRDERPVSKGKYLASFV